MKCIAIGCSAGGVHALRTVLDGLAPNLQAAVIVVCHVGGEDVDMLTEVLAAKSALPVIEARERLLPAPGTVHVAPAGYHLLIERDGRFGLSADAHVCYSRPSIDVLFQTAAAHFGAGLIGVVLTGANEDGASGLKAVRARGGLAIVQSPDEAHASRMPEAALRIAGADHIAALADIAPIINPLCQP